MEYSRRKDYGEVTNWKVGSRVEIHPCCDLWMRGARFGVVREVRGGSPTTVRVKMDHPGLRELQCFTLDLLRPMF